jgi:predicted acylesterase/phospholipase RssA
MRLPKTLLANPVLRRREFSVPKKLRVLAIDGGGSRGIIPATVLAEIERRTGKPISALFDVIAGTSTGGFQALLFVTPGPNGPRYSAKDVVELYRNHSKNIFHKSLWHTLVSLDGLRGPKYPAQSALRVFEKYFGSAELKDAVTQVMVTCYDMDVHQLRIFSKRKAAADPKMNLLMSQAARATTALPVAFPAAEIRSVDGSAVYHALDGGLGAGNPIILAMEDAITPEGIRPNEILALSLGTGEYDQSLPFQKMRRWGLLQWLHGLLLMDLLYEAMSHVATLEARRGLGDENFFRFQAVLPPQLYKSDLTAAKDLQAFQDIARKMLEQNSARFEKFLGELTAAAGRAAASGSGRGAA